MTDTDRVATATSENASGSAAGVGTNIVAGLALVAGCVAIAFAVHAAVAAISPLVVAVVLGALLTNLGWVPDRCRDGLRFATKRLLRIGIVLLGFRLALGDVAHLGGPSIAVVVGVVLLTFFGTQWLGAKLGINRDLSLLVATGFSICGASAIAAMEPLSDASEEDVAFSIALVTLCGSLAIAVLPPLGRLLGMRPEVFGSWVGASVHDVAQVVVTASTAGSVALSAAVVVKLTRVAMLAPMVAGVSVNRRRLAAST
ncbi:MAG TPA: putative sulfate exporter family transporter, partial [Ilumatobacteraceae bacterium]